MQSMTGYGKSTATFKNLSIIVEIRGVNSKNFDLRTRVPSQYLSKDIEIRKLLSSKLIRGKIDFTLQIDSEDLSDYKINKGTFSYYLSFLKELAVEQEMNPGDLFNTITKLPGVVVQNLEEINEDEWSAVLATIQTCLDTFTAYRTEEGTAALSDISNNIDQIDRYLQDIDQYEQPRIDAIKQRLHSSLEQIELNGKVDQNRLEQEMIFYMDKLDLNEEKIRLTQHLKYFKEEIENNAISKGKKLGFIAQEIGREINTIGSKANSATIQKNVIQMKNYLDKIKEQLANIL